MKTFKVNSNHIKVVDSLDNSEILQAFTEGYVFVRLEPSNDVYMICTNKKQTSITTILTSVIEVKK